MTTSFLDWIAAHSCDFLILEMVDGLTRGSSQRSAYNYAVELPSLATSVLSVAAVFSAATAAATVAGEGISMATARAAAAAFSATAAAAVTQARPREGVPATRSVAGGLGDGVGGGREECRGAGRNGAREKLEDDRGWPGG